jgi:hypothetical protein
MARARVAPKKSLTQIVRSATASCPSKMKAMDIASTDSLIVRGVLSSNRAVCGSRSVMEDGRTAV